MLRSPAPPTYNRNRWEALTAPAVECDAYAARREVHEPTGANPGEFGWTLEQFAGSFRIRRIDMGALRRRQLRDSCRAAANLALAEPEAIATTFVEEARLVRSEKRLSAEMEDGRPGTRGRITGWSFKSRLRMMFAISTANLSGSWGMLTLTLPAAWADLCPTPDEWRAMLRAFDKRLVRRWGDDDTPLGVIWKGEAQRRSAPHAHLGLQLPDDETTWSDLRVWCASNWHDIVCHDGARCPGAVECADGAHALYGAQLDTRYSNRAAGKSLAAYFAKHGVWRTKGYQNVSPGEHMRQGAHLIAFMAGIPVHPDIDAPPEPDEGPAMYDTRRLEFGPSTLDTLWGDWPARITAWQYPGRWWGMRRVERTKALERDLDPDDAEAIRLVCRKLFTRRTTRYGLIAVRGQELPVQYIQRRSLRSLRGSAGWWMLSTAPDDLVPWLVKQAQALRGIPPDAVEVRTIRGRQRRIHLRAEFLAQLVEPTDSTTRPVEQLVTL